VIESNVGSRTVLQSIAAGGHSVLSRTAIGKSRVGQTKACTSGTISSYMKGECKRTGHLGTWNRRYYQSLSRWAAKKVPSTANKSERVVTDLLNLTRSAIQNTRACARLGRARTRSSGPQSAPVRQAATRGLGETRSRCVDLCSSESTLFYIDFLTHQQATSAGQCRQKAFY
jgi:hypothetical protein